MTRDLAIQKCIALLLVAGSLFALTPAQTLLLFIALGHGHFLAAYYYQYKAGKSSLRGLFAFFALGALLVAASLTVVPINWLILASSVIFYIHHFQDEVVLFGKQRSLYRTLEQLPPLLLYSALTADFVLGTSVAPYALALSGLAVTLWLVSVARGRHAPDALSAFLFGVTGILMWMAFAQPSIAPEQFIGAIVLFHYVCWAVYYFYRFSADAVRQRTYVIDMSVIHILVFGIFALSQAHVPVAAYAQFVFAPAVFYVAAILHILFSVRLSDYKEMARW